MRISLNTDTYLSAILALKDELDPICEKVNETYNRVETPAVIGFAIRCLPDDIGRKTFTRYTQKDRYLTLDITISYEQYKHLQKIEQRHELGHALFNEISSAIAKYKFTDLINSDFLQNFKTWCNQIGWLEDEIDWSADPDT